MSQLMTVAEKLSWKPGDPYTVTLFYRYVAIDNVEELRNQLLSICGELSLLGRILIAEEGINGTVAGSEACVTSFIDYMRADTRFRNIDWKSTTVGKRPAGEASAGSGPSALPFLNLSIRIVTEIVSCGRQREFISRNAAFDAGTFGGLSGTGKHLTPQEFHDALVSLTQSEGEGDSEGEEQKAVLLDVRNQFEYDIGHFKSASPLNCATYAETWTCLDKLLENKEKTAPVYMYCTGGIRCEKASVYVKSKGFENVYHLQGGIHRYLEAFPDGGQFTGKNFVFDSRVSVTAKDCSEGVASAEKGSSDVVDGGRGSATEPSAGTANAETEVVGRCLDCSQPFDEFSGRVVCTVCRLPVLVCPQCREERCVPGEYHCYRHRPLKDVYYTVLDRFTESELARQRDGLWALEQTMLGDVRAKGRRLTLRKQRERVEAKIRSLSSSSSSPSPLPSATTASSDGCGQDYTDMAASSDCVEQVVHSVSHSTTEGAAERTDLAMPSSLSVRAVGSQPAPATSSEREVSSEGLQEAAKNKNSNPFGSCTSSSSGRSNSNSRSSSVRSQDGVRSSTAAGGKNASKNSKNAVPSLLPTANPLSNPKTRLGWGFWRS
jgi:UPF0176 protein